MTVDASKDLATAGQVVALAVAMLPFVGAAMRVVGFVKLIGPTAVIATGIPVAALASVAFLPMALGIGLSFTIEIWFQRRRRARGGPASPPQIGRPGKVIAWIVLVLLVLAMAYLLATFPGFPYTPLLVIVFGTVGWVGDHLAKSGPVTLKRVWPIMLVYAGVSLASAALSGAPLGTALAEVRFDTAAGVADGTYIELGRVDGAVFFVHCGDRNIVSVPAGFVLSERFIDRPPAAPAPTLQEVVFDDRDVQIGIRTECP